VSFDHKLAQAFWEALRSPRKRLTGRRFSG